MISYRQFLSTAYEGKTVWKLTDEEAAEMRRAATYRISLWEMERHDIMTWVKARLGIDPYSFSDEQQRQVRDLVRAEIAARRADRQRWTIALEVPEERYGRAVWGIVGVSPEGKKLNLFGQVDIPAELRSDESFVPYVEIEWRWNKRERLFVDSEAPVEYGRETLFTAYLPAGWTVRGGSTAFMGMGDVIDRRVFGTPDINKAYYRTEDFENHHNGARSSSTSVVFFDKPPASALLHGSHNGAGFVSSAFGNGSADVNYRPAPDVWAQIPREYRGIAALAAAWWRGYNTFEVYPYITPEDANLREAFLAGHAARPRR